MTDQRKLIIRPFPHFETIYYPLTTDVLLPSKEATTIEPIHDKNGNRIMHQNRNRSKKHKKIKNGAASSRIYMPLQSSSSNLTADKLLTYRSKIPGRQIKFQYSGLKAIIGNVESNNEHYDLIAMSTEPPHSYTHQNSRQSLERFIERGILTIDAFWTELLTKEEEWGQQECFEVAKLISVPMLEVKRIEFSGRGSTEDEADQECCANILEDLHEFDIIKEASVELHKNRKLNLDPTKELDVKLRAYLDSTSSDFFANKMDELSTQRQFFY